MVDKIPEAINVTFILLIEIFNLLKNILITERLCARKDICVADISIFDFNSYELTVGKV